MDGGIVENAFALRYAQKARALLKGLGAEFRYFFDLRAGGECTVFLAIGDNIFRCGRVQTGNALQKRRRGGVDVHADGVDAVLHHAAERIVELLLRHVVLVLPHADGLGVDLHKLGERVLQAPRDRHRRAEVHVVLRELLGGEHACRVNRRTCLGNDHVAHMRAGRACLTDQLHGHLLCLAAGSAVADGDMLHAMLSDELE